MNHCRWNLKPPVPADYWGLAGGFSPLMSQLLYNRGLASPSQAEVFLAADERLAGNPGLLPDINQAVPRIRQALLAGENIAVYGDFDSDGVTATVLLVRGLTTLGGRVIPYIPHRLTEGHGLKIAALEKLHRQGISLIITTDCGITALNEVKKANKLGLDTIICDHHTPLDELPPALASVNPQRSDSAYPFNELAGVGVAYKLLQALYQSLGKDRQPDGLLDLVAIGTVADMMPLVGENRYLVKEGLKLINDSPRLGIRELMNQARLKSGAVDSESISWVLAPRLNAIGRLEHAMAGYRLLMTDSPSEAKELAGWLEVKNTERQKLTATFQAAAREQILAAEIPPLLIFRDKECHAGIIGLVAGRLTDEFYRPAIAIKVGEHSSTGSCRSIPEFNITDAISRCRSLLTHFGGHARAAGFTLPTENLPLLERRLSEMAEKELSGVDLRPHLDIDVEVTLSQLSEATFKDTRQLAPFGRGNPAPAFLSRRLRIIEHRPMGNSGQHLRLKLEQGDARWDGVAFRMSQSLTSVLDSPLDMVYNLEMNHWHGMATLRLNIIDFAPSAET
ncbi:MAG: single-stranded-DNA-specific exonuclease RecJ [Dehalococcoidales bacterium]